jgi:hypothetical protein
VRINSLRAIEERWSSSHTLIPLSSHLPHMRFPRHFPAGARFRALTFSTDGMPCGPDAFRISCRVHASAAAGVVGEPSLRLGFIRSTAYFRVCDPTSSPPRSGILAAGWLRDLRVQSAQAQSSSRVSHSTRSSSGRLARAHWTVWSALLACPAHRLGTIASRILC